jgi:excisionase family DNA binding protein
LTKQWQSVAEACQRLAISQRTLYRRIDKGEIESKLENGKRYVLIDVPDDKEKADNFDNMTNRELIDTLQKENENLRKQVDQQQAIIMQLSRNQQLMLESSEQKARRGWLARLFRKASDDKN